MPFNRIAGKQCTLAGEVEFSGVGVHNGQFVTARICPAPADGGYLLERVDSEGRSTGPIRASHARVTHTNLCTKVDLGNSQSVSTTEHIMAALAGLGIDNARIVVDGPECPILDGSAKPFVEAILGVGVEIQGADRKFLKINRSVTVRSNDAYAVLEPYNGRAYDVEIDFDSDVIGHQRMIHDWTPRKFAEAVAPARTFGFVQEAKVLRQGGYALGSSLENSIAVDQDQVVNPEGLRFEDEFVRHKLLDVIGDLSLAGYPLYGRFRSYKGGHALNASVLAGLFDNPDNYELVTAAQLPLEFDGLTDLPAFAESQSYLRSVG
ncbi:UDP-3-O-acyl-N-acetylglucosamine deacetylase [Cucumibacter marinus]|uniref:UDP-3-O-acyl-N-acetylglucosamine deacetylase n=1 Tax=Cucumibacter marinus TaxID=1121252 RepID=UPI00042827D0|nr:UDP-3-O-acyl-N-acetylglucosamine deacetylase [Cucumibacter marinus]